MWRRPDLPHRSASPVAALSPRAALVEARLAGRVTAPEAPRQLPLALWRVVLFAFSGVARAHVPPLFPLDKAALRAQRIELKSVRHE